MGEEPDLMVLLVEIGFTEGMLHFKRFIHV